MDRIYKFVSSCKTLIIVFWLASATAGYFSFPLFLANTSILMQPPRHSLSAKAVESMKSHDLPQWGDPSFVLVLIELRKPLPLENRSPSALCEFSRHLDDFVARSNPPLYKGPARQAWGLCEFEDRGLTLLAPQFLSLSNKTAVITLLLDQDASKDHAGLNFVRNLRLEAHSLASKSSAIDSALVTGELAVFLDAVDETMHSVELMEAICLPIAFLIVAVSLRTWRFLILPLIVLAVSTLSSVAILAQLAAHWLSPPPFVLSVVFSASTAFVFDYCLFVFARWRLVDPDQGQTRAHGALVGAGPTIATSCSILAFSFIALVAFPSDILKGLGLGAGIAIGLAGLASLTFLPAVLLVFAGFFEPSALKRTGESTRLLPETEDEPSRGYRWFAAIGRFTTRYPIPILIVIVGLSVPFAWQLRFGFDHLVTVSWSDLAPAESESNFAVQILKKEFGPGLLGPFYVLIEGDENVLEGDAFQTAHNLIHKLQTKVDHLQGQNVFLSPAWVPGMGAIEPGLAEMLLQATGPEGDAFRWIWDMYVGKGNTSLVIQLLPEGIDPFGNRGLPFVTQTREVLGDYALSGGSTAEVDMIHGIYGTLPLMVGVVSLLVFGIAGFAYGSAVIALRTVFSVSLTLIWVFGMMVGIFVKGWLGFVKRGSLIQFLIPTLSLNAIIGLGLDFDVFVMTRIVELRASGRKDRDAIIDGLAETGSLISTAGLVMAMAFGGVSIGTVAGLHQFGFTLVCSVLLDMTLMRTIVAPAATMVTGRWTWWPTKMPDGEVKGW